MSSNPKKVKPQIYVACLASYNRGVLHGAWIDLGDGVDADDIRASIADIINESTAPGAEEWEIHDTNDLDGYTPGSIEAAAVVGELVEKHGLAPTQWLNLGHEQGLDPEQWQDRFEEEYRGEYDSDNAYVEEKLEESGLKSQLEAIKIGDCDAWSYLDVGSIAHDWSISSFYSARAGGKVYIFDR